MERESIWRGIPVRRINVPTLVPLPQNLAPGPPTRSILSLTQALASDVEGFLDYLLDGDNRLVMRSISNQTRTEARRQYIQHAGDKSLAPHAALTPFPSPTSSLRASLSSSLLLLLLLLFLPIPPPSLFSPLPSLGRGCRANNAMSRHYALQAASRPSRI